MDPRLLIYILCIVGGFILLIGGLILVAKKKVLIDPATGAVVDIEVPVLGKLKTNIPGIAFFVLGCALVVYPTYQVDRLSPVFKITGRADAGGEILNVYVALRPDIIEKEKKEFLIQAPYSEHAPKYEVLYISPYGVVSHHSISAVPPGQTVEVEDDVQFIAPPESEGGQ